MTAHRVVLPALMFCTVAVSAQQPRDPVGAPARTGTAAISGVVLSDERSPRPLRRTRVILTAAELSPSRTAITADDGSFVFDGLPPGRYLVSASKEAYVTMEFGARQSLRPGTRITLGSGQKQTGVAIRLPRGAVLTGMVATADGQPMPGMTVTPLARRFIAATGTHRLLPASVQPAMTDDRGMYRIYGLPPGEYAVAVHVPRGADMFRFGADVRVMSEADVRTALASVRDAGRGGSTPVSVPPRTAAETTRLVRFAPVYHPGTTQLDRATLVKVAAGEERTGLDVQVEFVPVATIEGIVGPAEPNARVSLTLLGEAMEADLVGPRQASAGPDGRFTFTSVTPGRYTILAGASSQGRQRLTGTTEITVSGEDVGGVAVTLSSGLTLSGRIVFEGGQPPPVDLTQLRIFLPVAVWTGTSLGHPISPPEIQADGRFVMRNVPSGNYRMMAGINRGLHAPIGRWWVKSITSGGRELLDAPLELRASADDVVVTFTENPTELSGTVRDSEGGHAPAGYVIAFSADRTKWFHNSRRVAAVQPDGDGKYMIRNLPPGEYLLAATADVERMEWFDPEFLTALAARAARVRLAEKTDGPDLVWLK